MKIYAIPAIIIATICLTIALSDVLAWVRRTRKGSDIPFVLVCLGGAAFCLCCAGEYNVDNPIQSIFWLKGEVIASTLSGFALLWFIAEETRLIDRRIILLGLAWMALSVLSQIIELGDLTWIASKPLVLRVQLPFGMDFLYQEVARGSVLVAITSVGFAINLYLVAVLVRYWRSGKHIEALVFFAALGFIVVAQIIDFFIGIGAFSFVFLLEYAWLGTILVVGLKRSNDAIEAAVTRKVLEETDLELKASQTTLWTIIDSTDDLIWSLDAESLCLLTFNRPFQKFFAPSRGAALAAGTRFAELLDSGPERQLWLDVFQRTLEEGACSIEIGPIAGGTSLQVDAHCLHRGDHIFGLSVFAHDITERKKAEDQLRRALSEKEVLLLEVYHRTKNNMNVIISILKLQSNQMGDQRLKDAFAISIDRIMTMSLVHSRLYKNGDLAHINLNDYLQELVQRLVSCHSLPGLRPALSFELDDVFVMIDAAINCGMIVNELVTNALKYAFTDGAVGTIRISLRGNGDGSIALCVADDGPGLPVDFDQKHHGRLGLRLIRTLAQDSLHGHLEFRSQPGFSCTVQFKVKEPAPVPDKEHCP